jgi:polyferredoxin
MSAPTSRTPISYKGIGLLTGFTGLIILLLAFLGLSQFQGGGILSISLLTMTLGVFIYAYGLYNSSTGGIKNDHNWFQGLTSRGISAYVLGVVLTGFYVLLYWYPQHLGLGQEGASNTGLIALFDPLSFLLKGSAASEWFIYGTLYTIAIFIFGVKFIWKYRHNKYQVIRTISVIFFQTGFAFLLPEFMQRLNMPYNDFKNAWPLNYYFFDEWNIRSFIEQGGIGIFMILFGVALIFIVTPILTYYFGKRWYCSWVCGCGGLAETAGDPFRHLSDKSLLSWKIERWMIHSVLLFSFLMTAGVVYTYLNNDPNGFWLKKDMFIILVGTILIIMIALVLFGKKITANLKPSHRYLISGFAVAVLAILLFNYSSGNSNLFFINSFQLRSAYGFYIGAAFSGVIGVGFYPILGSRVWCRFGCPMAAILGMQQKWFSKFRITTNGGQCISCGNCSTYCEMGIDVRSYAQKGQNIVRASCVGCGVCSAVCPRGVLKLENGSLDLFERTTDLRTVHIKEKEIGIL